MRMPPLDCIAVCLLALRLASGPVLGADGAEAPATETGTVQAVSTLLRSEEFLAIESLAKEADLDEKGDRLAEAYRKYQQVSQFYDRHPELSDCRNGCTCQRIFAEGQLGYIARLWRRNDEAIAHYRKALDRMNPSGSQRTLNGDVRRYSYLVYIHDLLAAQGKRGLVSRTEAEMAACEERIQARLRNAPRALDTATSELSRGHGCLVLRVKAVTHFLRAEFAQAQQAWTEILALAREKKLNREEAHGLLGQAELAVFLEDYERGIPLIEEALRLPPHPGCNRCQPEAMSRLALSHARRDGFRAKDLDAADAALAQLRALGVEDDQERMMRAQLLSLAGRGAEAMAEAEAVRLRARETGQALLEAAAICTKAKIAEEQGEFRAELGSQLQQALLLYREMGNKLREPFVYLQYGSWLAQDGQTAEALYVLNQGLRLCSLLDFPNITARILAAKVTVMRVRGDPPTLAESEQRLKAYLEEHPSLPPTTRTDVAASRGRILRAAPMGHAIQAQGMATTPADRTVALAGESAAWIQPMQAESVRLGDAAQARFSLQNLAGVPTSGRLGFRGAVIRSHCWNGDELRVDLIPVAEATPASAVELSVPLNAERLSWLALTAENPGDENTGSTVDLLWNGEPHAMWSIGGPMDQHRVGVTNSGLFALGPFVQVPVAHLIFNPYETPTSVNLRVTALPPCRVEFVDPDSGRLLGVDADGNGSFAEPGDDLWNDRDADGFPDLLLPAGPASAVVELWLYPYRQPGGGASEELIEVNLFLRHDGDWEKQASDHMWGRPD